MAELRRLSGKEFVRLLRRLGFTLRRGSGGSHVHMVSRLRNGETGTITVPVHGNVPLKIGLLQDLVDEASRLGVDRRVFESGPQAKVALKAARRIIRAKSDPDVSND